MAKVRRSKTTPPDGWELIEPTLDELEEKMREAQADPMHEGKKRIATLWSILEIDYQRSRYIHDLFYREKAISQELYDYCIKEAIVDINLIAKLKKQGSENLCCLECFQFQTWDTNFCTNCICSVPKSKLEEGKIV